MCLLVGQAKKLTSHPPAAYTSSVRAKLEVPLSFGPAAIMRERTWYKSLCGAKLIYAVPTSLHNAGGNVRRRWSSLATM